MKPHIFFLTISILMVCALSTAGDVHTLTDNDQQQKPYLLYHLEFQQYGSTVYPENGSVYLSKDEFKLRFVLKDGEKVFANFSMLPELYSAAQKTKAIESVLGFGGRGMAEYSKNPDREIVLTEDSWHVWPAPEDGSDRFNRFDRIQESSEGMICERTVRQVYDDTTRTVIPLSEISVIYLVYCEVAELADYEYEVVEIETVKLVFE